MTNIMIFQDVPVDMGASAMSTSSKHTGPAPQPILLEAVPLTAEAFAPYGQVIAFDDHQTVSANQGTARRLNYAASLTNLRPTSSHISPAARPNLALFRCVPLTTRSLQVKLLERHRWSTQMFMPVASTPDAVGYLVVVAQNGPDDLPDLSTLAAFRAAPHQGINYNAGIWHHPMVALDQTTDFISLTWENGIQEEDCQEMYMPVDITVNVTHTHERS